MFSSLRSLASASALLGLLAAASLAAQETSPPLDLGEFVVAGIADSPSALAPASDRILLEAADIAGTGAATAAEALRAAPGAFVNSNGGPGSLSTASLRGSTSAQVLVIVDGQRLNDARQGTPDLSLIPAESIERIEVLRGGASALYGPDALGGVIVITTKHPAGDSLAAQFSSTAWPGALAASGAKALGLGQRLAFQGSQTLGAAVLGLSAFGERAGSGWASGSGALRDNSDLLSGGADLDLALPLGGGMTRTRVSGSWQDAGSPGSLFYSSPKAKQSDSSLRGRLGWASDALAGGNLALDLAASASFARLDYTNPDYAIADRHDSTRGGLDLRASALLGGLQLGFGASLSREATNSTVFATSSSGQPERLTLSAYLEPSLELGALTLIPALRYDWNDNFAAGLSAMFGLEYKATEELSLRLSGGSSYRAPTFNELYWPADPMFGGGGNADLKAERGLGAETALSWRRGAFSIDATAFGRYVEDLIMNDAFFVPHNIGKTFSPGAELRLGFRGRGPLGFEASYEFLHPLDLSAATGLGDARLMENLSRHKVRGSVDLALGALKARLDGRWWSDRMIEIPYAAPVLLKGALVLDLKADLALSKTLALGMAAENLLNSDYQVNPDYPEPGLRVVTSLKWALR